MAAVLLLATPGCSGDRADGGAQPSRVYGGGIIFDNDTEDVWRVDARGTDRRRLTTNAAQEFDPSWSPDGGRIAYRSEVDGNSEVYVMDPDGTNKYNLTRNAAADYSPSWSPIGDEIAFASDRRTGLNDIYVMRADGSNVRRLTTSPSVDEYPTWSPDGKQIAYVSDRDGRWEIYVIGSDGTNDRRLTNSGGKLPAWSPDGSWIAFQGPSKGGTGAERSDSVWLIAPDGRNAHFVAHGFAPAWAPTGKALLVSTRRGLALLALDGAVRRHIVAAPALDADWVEPKG